MKLKTVVISLPQENERRVFIQKEMEKCNFSDYIIIDGVDGSNITEIPIIKSNDKLLISKLVYNGKTIIYDSRLRLNGSGLNKKEMGSAWTHFFVYNMLLKDDEYDAYLVFEDEAKLSVSSHELKIFLDELKVNTFDICHISTDFNKLKKISENYWIPEKNKFFNNNTTAYIVSKSGARKLLTATYMCMGLPAIDLISTLYIYSDDFNVIVSSKILFSQNNIERVNNKVISIKDFGIWARLGNQMFQYAYLRTLSIDKGFKIKLPINRSGHGYKNPHFFDAFDLPFLDISNTPFSNFHTISETSMLYDEKLTSEYISEKENIMFDGYFQCEKYFKKYEDIIRSDFTFKENIRINGNIFMENIKKTVGSVKLVALHVRRGDNLLHNSPTLLITDTFRNNAINFLSEKIGSYHILIFSDDKKWCSENLNYKDINQTVVNGLSDIEEMYVMSLCDHFIIGSSSYSWWSAWLSCNKDKIIVTPDKWFSGILGRGKPLCDQEKDLIPSEWIRLNISTTKDLKEKNLIPKKINIPFFSNITIVTGYFSASKPKVSQDTYEKWMDNFLRLNEYMIIFTDIQNYEYINNRRNTSNTVIIVTSIKEFKVAKYMDYWKYCHSIDLEKEHHSKEVYMVWNEKTYFVEKALNLNPFNSNYFFWMDIGCIRDVNILKSIHKFNVDGIPENKIILSSVTYNIPNNYLNENKISISFENRNGFSCPVFDYIQGGFFGGHKNALSDWIPIYTNELDLFVKTNTFGGKDQNIMGNIYLKYQQNFCLTQPKIFDLVNQWFSFLIKMSNLSAYI